MKSIAVICMCFAAAFAVPLLQKQPIKAHPNVRIVGGDTAADKQFPWQVAVYFDTANGTYFCGGALIANNWVLTSGHCVYHAVVFTLHLGANSLVDADPNRVTLGVSHSVVHPEFNPETLENDIGLIRIDQPFALNDYIQIIPRATSELASDVSVTVSGWGATGDWDGESNYLMYVALSTMSNEDCRSIYGQDVVKDSMVCARGPNNEGTCTGDNGSPLVTYDANKNAVHVGIVSWVSDHGCETNHPSGYTRTASYNDWIDSVIG